jgi:hypothetical protein
MTMKLLVGVLHTIENEFEECLAAIRRQTHTAVDVFVIEKLRNREAHERLYRTFMERAGEFDVFVKVDADMVLCRDDFFAGVARVFRESPDVDRLYVAVDDFFTQKLIMGLNCYRNTVRWPSSSEDLFVDAQPPCAGRKIKDWDGLAPAATHCKNPSCFQAFHFGVHKAVKAIQPDREDFRPSSSRVHWANIRDMRRSLRRTEDIRRAYAVLGSELALGGGIAPAHLDFDNPLLHARFEPYQGLNMRGLKRVIRAEGLRNAAFLPGMLRHRWLLMRGRRRRVATTGEKQQD